MAGELGAPPIELEKPQAEKLAIKDALIAIPFLASALALTWEIGYFARIRGGAFGLFSIAEHLTFALQALPVALAMSTMGVMGLLSERISKSVVVRTPRALKLQRVLNRYRPLIAFVSALVGLLIGAWYFPAGWDVAILVLVSLVPYGFVIFAPTQVLMNPLIICGGVLLVFIVALGIGAQSARAQIPSSLPLNKIKIGEKGKDTETEISVRILRTGERGVLYFDPVANTFGLLPWDSIKRVNWSISPFFSR